MYVRSIPALVITLSLTAAQPTLTAQQPGAPKGIESEQSLPDRYPYVRNWATQAKIPDFKVAGKGALSADDPQVGQGVWLWFTKQQ